MGLSFEGKVVVVTGGSRGLGVAFARCIAAAGGQVVITSTGQSDSGEKTKTLLADEGFSVSHLAVRAEDSDKLVESVVSEHGRLDAIVHNGGFVQDKTLRKMTDEQWQAVQDVHLASAFRLTRAAWPHFETAGAGRMVFISSSAGLYGNFGQSNYAAAKMGLFGLAQSIALEGAAQNICANVVAPFGATELNSGNMAEEMKAVIKTDYVAPIVGYLAHSDCEETGGIFEASAGTFKKVRWQQSAGLQLSQKEPMTIDHIAEGWGSVCDFDSPSYPTEMRESLQGMYAPHMS